METRETDRRFDEQRTRTRLVGRKRELQAIDDLLEAGTPPSPVMFISGEPGIGKSRLLAEAAARARSGGWAVLSGRAYDIEGMPPYIPFIEVIRQQLANSPDEAIESLASGAPELCQLLPDVCARLERTPEPARLGPEAERFRLFESVSAFLTGVARHSESRGVAILLDDLQWGDRPTLLLLQHLSRRLGNSRVVAIGAFRSTGLEPGHTLPGIVTDLARDHVCEELALQPLELSNVAELVEGFVGSPPASKFVSSLHRQTEGNPFFVEEVVRDLIARGTDVGAAGALDVELPGGVRSVIGRRLSMLSTPAGHVLQSAAVLGEAFGFDLLADSTDIATEELVLALEETERCGALRRDDESYAFTHALIRRTVYDSLSVPRRRELHRRVAEAMERAPDGIDGPGWGLLAHHWRKSGNPARATEYFLKAGGAAVNVAAWEEASHHWLAALECMERTGESPRRMARLLEGVGDLEFLSSLEASVASYDRAIAMYQAAGDVVGAARASSRAGRSLAYPTSRLDYAAASRYLRNAEEVLKAMPDSIELGQLYTAIGHVESHQLNTDPEDILGWIRRLDGIAERLDSNYLRISACSLEGHYRGLKGELARGIALEEQACERALVEKDLAANEWQEEWHNYLLRNCEDDPARGDDAGSHQLSRFLIRNYTVTCCGVQSLDLLDPVRARAKHELAPDVPIFLFYDLFFTGEVENLRQAVQACVVVPAIPTGQGLRSFAEGDWTSVVATFRARMEYWRGGGSNAQFLAHRILIRVFRAIGDSEAAEAIAQDWLQWALLGRAVKFEVPARAELALNLAETDRLDEAEAHLVRCREVLAAGEDWRGIGGRVELAEAAFAAASGDCAGADAHFEAALHVFRALTLPWDEAETFETWARACRRFHRGRIRQDFVTEKLGAARDVYGRIGAGQPWLDRVAEAERRLAVLISGVPSLELPDGLSSREAQVLRSIAAGRTNQQIADELFISLNTVARHVAHIFEKTGVANRAEAAAYAMRQGLTG